MSEQMYRKVEPLKEGVEVQYLGDYILAWKDNVCYKPTVGFIETECPNCAEKAKGGSDESHID